MARGDLGADAVALDQRHRRARRGDGELLTRVLQAVPAAGMGVGSTSTRSSRRAPGRCAGRSRATSRGAPVAASKRQPCSGADHDGRRAAAPRPGRRPGAGSGAERRRIARRRGTAPCRSVRAPPSTAMLTGRELAGRELAGARDAGSSAWAAQGLMLVLLELVVDRCAADSQHSRRLGRRAAADPLERLDDGLALDRAHRVVDRWLRSGSPGRRRRARGARRPRAAGRRAAAAGPTRSQILAADAPRRRTGWRRATARSRARGCCPASGRRSGAPWRRRDPRRVAALAAGDRPWPRRARRARMWAREQRDVLAPLAQRRHLDGHHRQPPVQVLAEARRARPAP